MARGRGTGKKSGSKPTSKARSTKQEVRERYAKAREDAQLTGLIPTTPEGSARNNEVVKPTSQSDAPQPALIEEAIRRGWAVPEEKKPKLVDELLEIIESQTELSKVKVAAFRALLIADKDQHERDHPELSKGKGGVSVEVNNTNTTNVSLGEVFSDIEVIEQAYERIVNETTNSETVSHLRANRNAQPLDEAQPNHPEEEPKAN